LEEIDTDPNDSTATVTSECNVDVPCNNTPFAYIPCWLKGDDDTANDNEYEHGYYAIQFAIEDAYEMDDWGTCDIREACQVHAMGWGFFCRRNA